MMLDDYCFKNRYLLSLSTAPTGMDNDRFLRYHKSHPWALPQPLEFSLSFLQSATCLVLTAATMHISKATRTGIYLPQTLLQQTSPTMEHLLSYTWSHSRRQETLLSFSVTLRPYLRWAGQVERMEERRGVCKDTGGKTWRKENTWQDPGVDGRILLKWIKKWHERVWTGLIWFRIKRGSGLLWIQ